MPYKIVSFFTLFFLGIFLAPSVTRAAEIIDIVFPVEGDVTFSDDFDDARSGGRTHNATDIMADKMSLIVSATDGTVRFAPTTEPSYGFMLTIEGDDGYTYNYIHINNDTPGTDDGIGGSEYAYAPGIEDGERVERGEHIAWVGDSGNAEETAPHLHFEIYTEDDEPVNPYESLLVAYAANTFDPELEQQLATSINVNQQISVATAEAYCTSDSLIRTEEFSTVYYCGQDGGRYVFQNEATFFSWYEDFDGVEIISSEEMGDIPLRGVVTMKPGTYMVKLLSVPKVYAVSANGTLRWIETTEIAEDLYGTNWAQYVRDLSDAFFPAYTVGENVDHS